LLARCSGLALGMKAARFLAVALFLAALLAGCRGLAPVFSVGDGPGDRYTVSQGDTLYSIAFRYGLDYRELAQLNGVGPPGYIIYPGQRLRLSGKVAEVADSAPGASKPAARKPPAAKVATRKLPPKPAATASLPQGTPTFAWPIKGALLGRFSLAQPVNKGIDIKGSKGDAVAAAADGVVVYAGGNLRGYGKLVIIKHNDAYLTAYGNNTTISVKEGQNIKRGDRIAKVGTDAKNRELLHFEIRRYGKPQDPLKYLPR
ncbi:MAG: peptidoglycan DD-metalloendopeptidase family protein, partial [Pseudomonadales bacterium]